MKTVLLLLSLLLSQNILSEIIWEVDHGDFGGDYASVSPNIALFEDDSFAIVARIFFTDPWGQEDTWGVLAKFGSNGALQWYIEDYIDQNLRGVIEIDDGCTITARYYHYSHYRVIKRDPLGEVLWELDIPDISIKNIIKFDSNSFILIGKINYEDHQSLMIKVNNQGNILWTRHFNMGGTSSHFLNGIITSDNCLAIFGRLASYESFVLKVNADGDSLWTHFNPEGVNTWIFENSENNLVVLSSSETMIYDQLGNIIDTANGHFDYGIDLPNQNNFLARNDEYGSPSLYDIFQFDYDINFVWTTDEYFRFYFIQMPDNGFLLIKENTFHFIRTNDELVSVGNNSIPNLEYQITNHPNPFNPSTTIKFSIINNSYVDISIYNIKGQRIKSITNNDFTQGSHSVTWHGNDELGKPVSSGVYLYKLNVNGETKVVKKCLLLK